MRKRKRVLPIIVMFLAAVLAVLIVLPVKSYAKLIVVPGKYQCNGGLPACLCGLSSGCSCVWVEEPTGA